MAQSYWQKRFELLEEKRNQTARQTIKSVAPVFDYAEAQIEKEINAWYQRFAVNNEITLQEAKKLLNTRELKEFRWDVEEYIKYGRQNAIDQAWLKELENASARYHISRLEALRIRTQNAVERAFGNELDALDEMAANLYVNDYYHTAYEIQRGLGIGWDVGQIDERKLNDVLTKPWTADKQTFSDRIWKSKTQLLNDLQTELTQMCILGKDPQQSINHIAKRMDVSKGQAGRLIMTEAAYFGSVAQKDCFKDLDVEKFEVVATLDSRTSDVCQQMDGKMFKMSDFQIGVTAPPFHVWCRSCTVPWFEDNNDGQRAARGADGKTYYVPADMTYQDWKNQFVEGGSKKGLTLKSGNIKIGHNDGYTTVDRIEKVDINDNESVKQMIADFCAEFSDAKIEHSLVVSKDGYGYYLSGLESAVNPSIIGTDKLIGSVGIHNHPIPAYETMGDSFSVYDLIFSAKMKTGMQYLTSGERRNLFVFKKEFTEDEISEAWNNARSIMLEKAFSGEIDIDWEQEEILKILNNTLEGFEFYENF